MKRLLLHMLLLALTMATTSVRANAKKPATDSTATTTSPVKVSLITFYPGNEIFEVFGHSEILVTDSTGSYYINYGVFDFNSPGFLGRYIMGETDYLCAVMPPEVDGGVKPGRKMIRQDLNLTPQQAQLVWDKLKENVQPQNREYRYRHFSDNCSTRPRDMIEAALGHELDYSRCNYVVGKTLRQVMSHYTRNYPWEQFGIDLALGAACDTLIDSRTQTFVPLFLMHALDGITVEGSPLVLKSSVIEPGSDQGLVAPPTPWYLSPLAMSLLVAALVIVMSVRDWRSKRPTRWFDSALYGIAGLSGCIIFFLVFISTHEATSPNYNILWLHPLLLLLAVLPWIKRASTTLRWCHWFNIALIATMAMVWVSGLQAPNAAFIPLAFSLLLRSVINVMKR